MPGDHVIFFRDEEYDKEKAARRQQQTWRMIIKICSFEKVTGFQQTTENDISEDELLILTSFSHLF
jgi:hypothetical protein